MAERSSDAIYFMKLLEHWSTSSSFKLGLFPRNHFLRTECTGYYLVTMNWFERSNRTLHGISSCYIIIL